MRLNFIFLLILIGPGNSAFGQRILEAPPMPVNDPSTLRHFPYYSNKKNLWGYADSKGKVLIKPAFQEVKGFYKGFAGAKAVSGWGIINEKGRWVIQPENDMVECRDYIDAFVMQKKDKWIVKHIRNGQLSDQPPADETAVMGVEFVPYDDNGHSETAVKVKTEIRRFFREEAGSWQLGEFIIRSGKPDSLISSKAFNRFTFTEPIKTFDNRMFSLTRSSDGNKVGLVSWHSDKWSVSIVEPTYDSIWAFIYANPTFYGSKEGKVALINFDTYVSGFYESPPQFDEVKNWSTVYYVVRLENAWYRVKHFGFYLPSTYGVRTEIKPELIIRDVDDILPASDASYYLYRKNDLLGIVFNRNAVEASLQNDDWFIIPAKFTEIKRRDYWFEHGRVENQYTLFDVTLKDGKKGPMTVNGTLLFE